MKKLLFVFLGFLIISSCEKDKKDALIPVESISFPPSSTPLKLKVGETSSPLTPTILPANASDKSIEWKSSDATVATVSKNGVVTGVKAGLATITAKSKSTPSKTATCAVTVSLVPVAVTDVILEPATLTLAVGGQPRTLIKTITPANATNQSVTYASNHADIASVSAEGVVTAVAAGDAVITVTTADGNKTATCTVTVTVPVSTITLASNPTTLTVGGTAQLTPTVEPENAFNKTVTWGSSDVSKATVSSSGLVTGIARGSVTITATAADGSTVKGEITFAVKSADATISAITLGAENFVVAVPAEGATTTITNAPRTVFSDPSAVRVNITAADGATIKAGETAFTSGQTANFANAVTFTVTAEDGTTDKTYTVAITAYEATANPYGIYTAAHLNDVRNDKGGSYKMMSNIPLPERNAAGATATGIADYAEKGWLPIAHDAVITLGGNIPAIQGGFTGKFDGGGFFIDNFYINRNSSADEYVGLFGVTSGAAISNVGIKGSVSRAVTGSIHVGALAAYIVQGSVSNCYTEAAVYLESNYSGGGYFVSVGGLFGYSLGAALSKSYSSGNVLGNISSEKPLYIGGLLGYIQGGTIRDCFATGSVTGTSGFVLYAGALAGQFFAIAANCYATGNVVGTAELVSIGYLGCVSANEAITHTNCHYNSAATLTSNGAPVTEPSGVAKHIAKAIAEMRTDAFRDLLNNGSTVWGRDGAKNNGGLPFIIGVGVGKP